MDAALKELDKLQKLTSSTSSAKSKTQSIQGSLDSLLKSLNDAKAQVEANMLVSESASAELTEESDAALRDTINGLPKLVEARKKDMDDRQKEIYNVLSKVGKVLDKVYLCFHSCVLVRLIAFIGSDLRVRSPLMSLCSRLQRRRMHLRRLSRFIISARDNSMLPRLSRR
jgi:hypothetical protein